MNEETGSEPWFPVQRKLADDDRGVERDALIEKLDDCARSIKRKMDVGVSPGEFAQLDRLRAGLAAATQVVAAVWRRYHPA